MNWHRTSTESTASSTGARAIVSWARRPLSLPEWSWLVTDGSRRRGGMVVHQRAAEAAAEAAWRLLVG